MEHEVFITIESRQKVDGQVERMEMATTGRLTGTPEDYKISYREMEGELAGCLTSLHVQGGRVVMLREGVYASEMIIERGRRHNCCYSTPYGDMMMGVFANDVTSSVKGGEGELRMAYTLDCNEGLLSENRLRLLIKKKKRETAVPVVKVKRKMKKGETPCQN